MKYFISIVVPCYNKQNHLRLTLDSLVKQTIFPYLEIICIDDCSTDKTPAILAEYANKYNNIKVFRNEKNSSVFVSRKRGIQEATGRYIGWLDPDDWVDPSYYEEFYKNRMVNVGENGEIAYEADIVENYHVYKYYSKTKIIFYDDIFKKFKVKQLEFHTITKDKIKEYFLDSMLFVWNKIFKRETLQYVTRLPNYYINYSEDYLISIIGGLNANYIKKIKTKAALFYNLSNEIHHLSRSSNYRMRDESYAQVFHIIDSYLLEFNKLDYYGILKQLRRDSIIKLSNNLGSLFDKERFVLEMFQNHDFGEMR